MKYELFKEVVLLKDIPGKKLKKGDVATIVEHHPSATSEDGYSLEVFNALGDTVAVVTVSESEIETFYQLPQQCRQVYLVPNELTFVDYRLLAEEWLEKYDEEIGTI
ncbi:DUF4926 domain-containing protein [candidate division KSB1 bacterium]|nr:DUF4926 domain-containing protein [candidate division KSB1 bacterium]